MAREVPTRTKSNIAMGCATAASRAAKSGRLSTPPGRSTAVASARGTFTPFAHTPSTTLTIRSIAAVSRHPLSAGSRPRSQTARQQAVLAILAQLRLHHSVARTAVRGERGARTAAMTERQKKENALPDAGVGVKTGRTHSGGRWRGGLRARGTYAARFRRCAYVCVKIHVDMGSMCTWSGPCGHGASIDPCPHGPVPCTHGAIRVISVWT